MNEKQEILLEKELEKESLIEQFNKNFQKSIESFIKEKSSIIFHPNGSLLKFSDELNFNFTVIVNELDENAAPKMVKKILRDFFNKENYNVYLEVNINRKKYINFNEDSHKNVLYRNLKNIFNKSAIKQFTSDVNYKFNTMRELVFQKRVVKIYCRPDIDQEFIRKYLEIKKIKNEYHELKTEMDKSSPQNTKKHIL